MTAAALDRADFRLRSTTRGYAIAQRVGGGWELLSDRYPTTVAALAAIRGWLRPEREGRNG
jgi:hypothetical protein